MRCRFLALVAVSVASVLGCVASASSASAPPTLTFKLFVNTSLPLGQVLWTGSSFVYIAEHQGRLLTSDPQGQSVQQFASFAQGGDEMRCAEGLGAPYWPAGVYCHMPDNRILRISSDGQTISLLTRLPSSAGNTSDGAIAFDNVGHFGHRMLVASGGSESNGGAIFAVTPKGKVTRIGGYPGPGGADNITVASTRFGTASGDVLITVDENKITGSVMAMDSHGRTRLLASHLGNGVNPLNVIRASPSKRSEDAAAPGFYFGDTESGNVYMVPAAELRPYVGDVIVGGELHSWFWILRPTHSGGFQTLRLETNLPSKQWALEGAAYVP
jgi:hypothetical protein